MTHNRTSPTSRKTMVETESGPANDVRHEEMIPVMGPDGRWKLVPGGPESGDIFENSFATFTEWDVERDSEGSGRR